MQGRCWVRRNRGKNPNRVGTSIEAPRIAVSRPKSTPILHSAPIRVQDKKVGALACSRLSAGILGKAECNPALRPLRDSVQPICPAKRQFTPPAKLLILKTPIPTHACLKVMGGYNAAPPTMLGEADTRAKLSDPAIHARDWTENLIRRAETAGAIEIADGKL